MTGPGPARQQALEVLRKVRAGVAINEALAGRSKKTALSQPDRALMAQLAYGVLRHRRYLDAWMAPFRRGELDADIEDILRMGLFQLGFLTRIPPYAVVHAAVEQAKAIEPRAAGLVNAILRRGQAKPPTSLPLAVRFSHPDWLVRRWQTRFGDRLAEILEADNAVPSLTLRVMGTARAAVMEQLQAQGIAAEPSPYVPEAIRVTGSLWLESFEPFCRGQVVVQDESGMLASWVVDPQPGENILDLAAGLGGKTTHLADRLGPQGHIVAVDVAKSRLQRLRENLTRVHMVQRVQCIEGDGRQVATRWAGRFDAVLLDAPCSGLGVLRRRVDARWKKAETDLPELHRVQVELLTAAIQAVKPGGRLVYSTCSIEPEETVAVITEVVGQHPDVELESVAPFLPHVDLRQKVSDGQLWLAPGDLGMDGFYIARMRRREGGE